MSAINTVIYVYRELTKNNAIANEAAAELADMTARLQAAETLMQEAIDNCETGDCARCRTFADYIAALKAVQS